MSDEAKKASRNYLFKMGVEILTEVFVKDYDGDQLQLSNGRTMRSRTVIWAAGVTGNTLRGLPAGSVTHGSRLIVNRQNLVAGSHEIYAIGDISYMETPLYPKGHPQLANVAINQAKNLAKNLKRLALQKDTTEFEYRDLGSMATIGRNKAVVDLPFMKFKGYIAWLVWMFLHLMLILSVRNKLIIFINWSWAYITKDTSLRLILKPNEKK
jgi:NADH dehydrogenase